MRLLRPLCALVQALAGLAWFAAGPAAAEQVAVRYNEGLVRGFLVLRTIDGETIAGGEMNQLFRDGRVTNRLTFRFQDGSLHDETAMFTQRRRFRLVSYHLVQKGPSFPTPMDVSIERGRITVRYKDDDGNEKVETDPKALPADVSNGLVMTLAKNVKPGTPETVVSMMAATPKPQLVQLKITSAGRESFSAGGLSHEAIHYVVKVDIGGVKGVLAKLLGKQPPDHHIWIATGDSPGFVKAEGAMYLGGPPWRIELASPTWR
jgi:hypothetical protein